MSASGRAGSRNCSPGIRAVDGAPQSVSRAIVPFLFVPVASCLLAAGMGSALSGGNLAWFFLIFAAVAWFSVFGLLDGIGAVLSRPCLARLRAVNGSLRPPVQWPPVAVLIPCCDDFQEAATKSALSQDYPDYHLFLLDDSTNISNSQRIQEFCARHSDQVTYHRRRTKRHAKAGNLNAGLALLPHRFRFICLCDADERMPPQTVRELALWLLAHRRTAFVQSLHVANPPAEAGFACCLRFMVGAFWRSGMPWRMWFGMPTLLGHGCLLRREALEEVGGFPECSSEDIRLTGLWRRRGWFGVIAAPAELPGEDVPATLALFRRRLLRWAKQDAVTLMTETATMFRAGGVSLAEKLDWFFRNLKFPVRGLALPYWFALAIVAATVPGEWPPPPAATPLLLALALGCLTAAPPLLVYALDCVPLTAHRLVDRTCTVISIALFSSGSYSQALISLMITRSVDFVPTGQTMSASQTQKGGKPCGVLETAVEQLLALSLVVCAVMASQAVLATLGVASLAGATLSGVVARFFPTLRWALPLALAVALVWDVAFAGHAICAILALVAATALLG